MAEHFGKQLLDAVEIVGFDQVLDSVRHHDEPVKKWFGCAQFDKILSTIDQHASVFPNQDPPIIEITSQHPGAGKTHLLYLLTALATLPHRYGGQNTCVVIVDSHGFFSVQRLAQHIRHRLLSRTSKFNKKEVDLIVKTALYHVHIYKPQSMPELVETITSISDYFLHSNHFSIYKRMGFVAIDSASIFYWQTKLAEEDAAFNKSIAMSSSFQMSQPEAAITFTDLARAIETTSKKLHAPVIYTTKNNTPLPNRYNDDVPRILRPSLPTPMWQITRMTLIARRIPIRKMPADITITEALREKELMIKAHNHARHEAFVNFYGLNNATVQALRDNEDGFFFRIRKEGLTMERSVDQYES